MSRRQESQRPGRSSRSIAQDDMEDYIQQVTRYDPELYGRELENVHTQYKTDMVRAIENCPSLLELVPATNSIQDRLVGNFRMIQSQQLEEERFFARGHHIFDQFLKTAKVPVPSCWVVSMPQLPSRGTLLAASDGYEATISHTPLYDHPHDNATTTDLPGPQLDIYARIHESRDEPDGIHSGASQVGISANEPVNLRHLTYICDMRRV